MPTFELAVLIKTIPRPALASALKRTATAILDHGGVIRKIDNLGLQPTPYKISSHGAVHRQANYFVFNYDAGITTRSPLMDNYRLDVDIVRCKIIFRNDMSHYVAPETECTLHEDLLPPPYRASVQEMVEHAEKRTKPKYKYNSGMDYYPFQRRRDTVINGAV